MGRKGLKAALSNNFGESIERIAFITLVQREVKSRGKTIKLRGKVLSALSFVTDEME